ncbi:type VI secretion system protein VasD [Rhizobium sp. BK313]|uniref:type VI secretion system lipoprotein TssJ n=1 Tax=Rhizobium sp. BK313 TaxID=2587081 RepID=UPI0010DEBDFB|nr:type VI secretion system lipoprotein TssJ [Rhizobium sp. BK313]MBB3457477.1 type VI secretion system protein VasD [Rhizobium sp. BK313]
MTVTRRAVFEGLGASALLALAGCGHTPDPTPTSIVLNADPGINPGETGAASPVVVRIYELKGIKAFNNANFFDFDKDTQLLGADLIASREYEMTPGSQQKYQKEISSEAAYIGVVASFRNIQSATWRDSIELHKGSKNRLVVYLTSAAVRIQKASGWFG